MNFSVVVPTYNRPESLRRCLRILGRLRYRHGQYEIIVVDNNSNYPVERVVQQAKRQSGFPRTRMIMETKQGPSFARNSGSSLAAYTHVVFVDDDIIVPENMLDILYSVYRQYPQASIVGGRILVKFPRGSAAFIRTLPRQYWWVMGELDWGTSQKLLRYPELLFSAAMAVNKLHFADKIFSEKLGIQHGPIYLGSEDYELCVRASLNKLLIIYEPRLSALNIVEANRLTHWYVFKRHFAAGIERRIIDDSLKQRYPLHHRYHYSPC